MTLKTWHRATVLLVGITVLAVPVTMAQTERIEIKTITYKAAIDRDPFAIPDFGARGKQGVSAKLDLRQATLVGVVDGPDGFFALLEDEHGESYTVLKGDFIRHGRVSKIEDDHLEAWVRINGLRQRLRLNLTKEGD